MNNKIEQIIGEIEDYIESCKYQSFSNTKIIVNKDELEDLLNLVIHICNAPYFRLNFA